MIHIYQAHYWAKKANKNFPQKSCDNLWSLNFMQIYQKKQAIPRKVLWMDRGWLKQQQQQQEPPPPPIELCHFCPLTSGKI